MRLLEKTIDNNLVRDPNEVRKKLREMAVYRRVDLPLGERAIYAVPRGNNWQLPRVEEAIHYAGVDGVGLPESNKPISFVMRRDKLWVDQPDVGFNLFPQQLIVHKDMTKALEEIGKKYMRYCAKEPTWVQKNLGAAFAIGRFDVVIHPDGRYGVCEEDGEASLWGDAHEYNQIVETYILGLIGRLKNKGYDVVSTELPEVSGPYLRRGANIGTTILPSGEMRYFSTYAREGEVDAYVYHYQHNDAGNDGAHIPFIAPEKLTDKHLVIPRGRRGGHFLDYRGTIIDFKTFMKTVEPRSLIPGRMRDCKASLSAIGLGVLTTKKDAFEAARMAITDDSTARWAIKGLFSARTKDTVIVKTKKGTRRPGEFTLEQAMRRLGSYSDEYGDLVIVQPAYEYPTARDLGLTFNDEDPAELARYSHVDRQDVERFTSGMEKKYNVICRIFILYDQTHKKSPIVVGGLASGLSAEIVHNTKKAAVWPLFCEGVNAYPGITPYYTLKNDNCDNKEQGFHLFERRLADYSKQALRPDGEGAK
jgi:hypothetical protein